MQSSSSPSKQPRDLTWLVAFAFTVIWVLFIHGHAYSSNETSRLASIEALVERGTWDITPSRFATVDKIEVASHFVSDKPPLLSWLGAGVYSGLYHGFGLSLQATGCDAEQEPAHCRAVWEPSKTDWAFFILILLFVSTPGTLMLVLAYRLARQAGFSNLFSLTGIGVLGLGTALFPYSTVFTNHVPAAAALFVAVYLLIRQPRPTPVALACSGACAALSFTLDLSLGIFLVGLGLYVVWTQRKEAGWFILGGLMPLLLAGWLDYQVVGNPWPPQFYASGYDYAGSEFGMTVAGNQPAADIGRYIFDLLVGQRGFLAFYPIVGWALWAVCQAAFTRDPQPRRLLAWTIGLSTAFYVIYFAFSTNNFGGHAYSPRWLLNPVPVLAIFALSDPASYRSRVTRVVLALLSVYSMVAAYWGALDPWVPAYPPLRLAQTAHQPSSAPAIVLAGYSSLYALNDDLRLSWETNNLQPRWVDATQGLVVPNGETWWVVNSEVQLAPELAHALDLPQHGPFVLQADRTALAEQWQANLQTTVYESQPLVPSADSALVSQSLPLAFGQELLLLGYRLDLSTDQLNVLTAWRITATPPAQADYKVFVHLLATSGQTLQQSDILAARYNSLRAGDLLMQIQRLTLEGMPQGTYWLELGVYNPLTGERLLLPDGEQRLLLSPVNLPTLKLPGGR